MELYIKTSHCSCLAELSARANVRICRIVCALARADLPLSAQ
jgi:hypothetical protein